MSEPTAVRTTLNLDTAIPISPPMTMASAKPTEARRIVIPIARHVTCNPSSSKKRGNTVPGPGSA
ncbi:unannotated protein [freshwater metagenome]|uniref:Unannotated protein n=1 Tax=freshwater metagenome TaxID=449393 RepID=A0A6J7EZS1_9ZZZZ